MVTTPPGLCGPPAAAVPVLVPDPPEPPTCWVELQPARAAAARPMAAPAATTCVRLILGTSRKRGVSGGGARCPAEVPPDLREGVSKVNFHCRAVQRSRAKD